MKFGIFYELQLPRPWGVDDERQLYQNALTQVELADRLGYDYAWEVEHHFLEEYSHSPAPEVFLGAASQRTKKHPAWPRDRSAHDQSTAAGRGTDCLSRSGFQRTGRIRHRGIRFRHRTWRLRSRDGNQAGDLGRRDSLHPSDVPGQGRRARHQMA